MMAALLLVGALALGVTLHQRTTNTRIYQQAVTADALGQARAQLRDFAQHYALTHAGQTTGYLPCPDLDGDGSAETDCPASGAMSVGLFPYRTLGSAPLKDGHGECLWYAVAGTFKDNPKKPDPALMNWDTAGQFSVLSAGGRAEFTVTRPTHLAAAVVISPGPTQQTQVRDPRGNRPCIAPGLTSVEQAEYLESDFSAPSSSVVDVLAQSADSSASNDQVAWLRPGDIFDAQLFRSAEFGDQLINAMMNQARDKFAAMGTVMLPPPVSPTRIGDVEAGQLPTLLLTDASSSLAYLFREWKDQFRYLRCVASATARCMATVSGSTCRGILLFAGVSLEGQDRPRGLDTDFFESNVNALRFPESAPFLGSASFLGTSPSLDLVLCL